MPSHFNFLIEPDAATLRRWTRTHDYLVWTDCRPADAAPLVLWEAHGKGVVRLPNSDALMHVIAGGVPHHVEGLFGYWRACDSDIVWLRAAGGGVVRYVMVLGGSPAAYEKDAIQWICPICAGVIERTEIATGWTHAQRFWRREADIVAAFNADPARRTCPACAHVHPPAYRFRRAGVVAGDAADAATVALAW